VPADGAGEELGFFEEFLDVVFAKVRVYGRGGLVEGEDVVCGFQLGDGDEADLGALVICVMERLMEKGADISAALVRGIDAGCYAGNVFGELLRALGIYLHVFGHG
jgi:hypothetical protein